MVNLETKKPVFSEELQESISYWKWLSPNLFGFVTATGVYTINLEGKKEKLYSLPSYMSGVQLTGFVMDNSGKWYALSGLSAKEDRTIIGTIVLYNSDKSSDTQKVEGFTPSFGELPLSDPSNPSIYMAFVNKKHNEDQAYLQIMEIAKVSATPLKKKDPISYALEQPSDFPVSL